MEAVTKAMALRFTLGKQSSLAPDRSSTESDGGDGVDETELNPGVRLMYLANEGDLEGIVETLESGIDVNFRDIDDRTALHVAACQGLSDVVQLLLDRGAKVDTKDRWGSSVRYRGLDLWFSFCFPFFGRGFRF